jgi:hypothetical protein
VLRSAASPRGVRRRHSEPKAPFQGFLAATSLALLLGWSGTGFRAFLPEVAHALARLLQREHLTEPDDPVFPGPARGGYLDRSRVRRDELESYLGREVV